MPTIGPMELVVILVILLLLFGAKKLPELARSIGTSAKELKGAMRDEPNKGKAQDESKDKKSA
ncbi:MAG TPA: twin-arginine translocase TatA/TatE family subunit [Candidatus Saccharibacteria bacterium]|nr:twin-arginine translocase TatA/TatE family subunit [Candidatus Saccharibacteria bacterium]